MPLNPTDWDELERIAADLGLSPGKAGAVRRRCESPPDASRPLTLLAGCSDSGLEAVLERWAGPEAVTALRARGGRPILIGPEPIPPLPTQNGWATLPAKLPGRGHVVAVAPQDSLPADIAGLLAGMAPFALLDWVTPLGRAMTQSERAIVEKLSPLAATARVVVVGLGSEEVTARQLEEVSRYARAKLAESGFGGRALPVAIWFAHGPARAGSVPDPVAACAASSTEVASGFTGMRERAVGALVAELRSGGKKSAPPIPIDADTRQRLAVQLTGYLSAIGRQLQQGPGQASSLAEKREIALTRLKSWGAYAGIEGMWMKHVETLRPGEHAALMSAAGEALQKVTVFQQASTPAAAQDGKTGMSDGTPIGEQISLTGKRVALAVLLGGIAAVGVHYSLQQISEASVPAVPAEQSQPPAGPQTPRNPRLPELVVTAMTYATALLFGLFGYGLARRLFPSRPTALNRSRSSATTTATFTGWPDAERHILAWFVQFIEADPSPAAAHDRFVTRHGLEKTP